MRIFMSTAVKIKETPKGVLLTLEPDSNGPKIRELRVGSKMGNCIPERAKVLKLGDDAKPFYVLVPETNINDNRAFVMWGFNHWIHRSAVDVDKQHTTAKILDVSYGYGAWGAGVAFIAVMEPGQRVVSSVHDHKRMMLEWDGENFSSLKVQEEFFYDTQNGEEI